MFACVRLPCGGRVSRGGLPATPISAGTAGSCSFRVPVQQPVTQIKTYHLFDTLYTFADFVQGNNLSYLKICIVL